MWRDEALDFTPWLAKNLELLGSELGLRLENPRTEVPVGPYRLDILADEADSGLSVAIENQLEWTNTHHLGQLVKYATCCKAKIAVWVAPEFLREHAVALKMLNEWTHDDVQVYGIKLEVRRGAQDSPLVPTFTKVVYPGGWEEELVLPPDPPMPVRERKFHDFYQRLIVELAEEEDLEPPVIRFDYSGRLFGSRNDPRIGYAVSLEGKNDAYVTLHIQTNVKEESTQIFDRLFARQQHIEKSLEAVQSTEWVWNRHSGRYFSSISIRTEGSIYDRPEEQQQTMFWMKSNLVRFKNFFNTHLDELLSWPAPGDQAAHS